MANSYNYAALRAAGNEGQGKTKYAADFYDVTTGCSQISSIPGYCAGQGWDPVTGLGTPNAANLIPDLIAATRR